ncbi:VWA domain-containing protein, partial [bacterium]|nr:VWA domain-containing protein [bacterium]
FPKNQSTKAIVFLTDGQPTAGITGIEVISQNMTLGNIQKIRTFVFGVGEDVSTQLLDKIALENRGEAMYVRPNEDLSAKLTCFYETISKPLLVDLSIDWGGINVSENFPKQIPNVYKGSQLVVVGRYSKGGPANVKVSGELNGKRLEFPLEVNFVENNKANRFVSRQWAKTKADSLIQEIRAYGEDPQKKAEVIKLSKTFQFTTPYTSFIAVDPVKVVSNSDLDKFRSSKQANSLVSYQPSQGNWTSHGNSNIDDTTDYRAPAGQVPTIIQNAQAKKPSLWGFFPAALLVPNFKKAREQARGKACCANMRVILGAVEMYNMDHSVFATKITDYDVSSPDSFLIKGGYLKNTISRPEAGCKYGATGDLTPG